MTGKTPMEELPEAVYDELSKVGFYGFLTRLNELTMPINVSNLKIYVHLTQFIPEAELCVAGSLHSLCSKIIGEFPLNMYVSDLKSVTE